MQAAEESNDSVKAGIDGCTVVDALEPLHKLVVAIGGDEVRT